MNLVNNNSLSIVMCIYNKDNIEHFREAINSLVIQADYVDELIIVYNNCQDGTDIILGDAPETGADFFILTFKSLGVSEPADNSVTSAKIVDGAIVNADRNASAAIAGTKISPSFIIPS